MSERPDQWYLDALERKHSAILRAAVCRVVLPLALGVVAVAALVVIAFKL